MNGKFLLDTNIILGFLKGDTAIVNYLENAETTELCASVITRMELLSFHNIAPEEKALIVDFLNLLSIVPLNHDVERTAIRLRRATRRKLPDAIVAASAIESQATLITCDHELLATEFSGLQTLNPKMPKGRNV